MAIKYKFSLYTVCSHVYNDYFYWIGRVSAQIQVYLLFNRSYPCLIYLIDLINAFAMTVLIVYLYKSVIKNHENILSKKFIVYISLFIMYFSITGFIKSAIWKTAGIQYLWGMSLLVYMFYTLYVRDNFSPIKSILLAIIIGLYNEAFLWLFLLFSFSIFI